MNADRIIAIHDELHEKSRKLMVDKNHDYAGIGGDALSNFKGAAKELGLNGLDVWGVHFYKQVSALMSLVRKGCLKAESVESRVLDIRNYTALLMALIEDGVVDDEINEREIKELFEGWTSRSNPDRIKEEVNRVCPICKSTNIGLKNSGKIEHCLTCGYEVDLKAIPIARSKPALTCPSCSSTHIVGSVCKTCGTDLVACVGSKGE